MKSNIISYEAVQKLHDLFIQEKNKLQNSIALIKEVIGRCDYEIK